MLDIRQKLPEVVRNAKSFAKRQTLLISCRAKSGQAYLLTKKEVSKLKKKPTNKQNNTPKLTWLNTHDIFPNRMIASPLLGPGLHSLFHRIVKKDWCSSLFLFVNLHHMKHCIRTTLTTRCNYHRLLLKIKQDQDQSFDNKLGG